MSTTGIIILIVIIVALLVAGAAFYLRQRRSERLRQDFGPEYDREVGNASSRTAAEQKLHEREKRHHKLNIRPLERDERADYRESWEKVQRGFVDSPGDAVREADRLVIAIMSTRGYPTDDFEQRADDVSVEHPDIVEHYRQAHQVAVAQERGDAGTEDLRHAAISYRSLVQALLEDRPRAHDSTAPLNGDRPQQGRAATAAHGTHRGET